MVQCLIIIAWLSLGWCCGVGVDC